MKQFFITLLLLTCTVASWSKTFKTIKTPKVTACAIPFKEKITVQEVVLTDTATTLHLCIESPTGDPFILNKSSYLKDESGHRYALRSAEGVVLDQPISSPKNGPTQFALHFAPMPQGVRVFDFIGGDDFYSFMLLGIHDKNTPLTTLRLEALAESHPYVLPTEWFKNDSITIRGRIKDYDAAKFGFNHLECYYENIFEKDQGILMLNIAPDGTFEKKFSACYPVREAFFAGNSNIAFSEIPFFARPGETIDVTVQKNARGQYECQYNNGSCKEMERWLKAKLPFNGIMNALRYFNGPFSQAQPLAETLWKNALTLLALTSERDGFTPMEEQLALADLQVSFASALIEYAMNREDDFSKKAEANGQKEPSGADKAEMDALNDPSNFKLLSRIPFDNPLLTASSNFPTLINRLRFAPPVFSGQFASLGKMDSVKITADIQQKILNNKRAALKKLMRCNDSNLMLQICIYKDIQENFKEWRNNEALIPGILADTSRTEQERLAEAESLPALNNMLSPYLEVLSSPFIRQQADLFCSAAMMEQDIATPLPANNAAAERIRQLSARFPGRYLLIDFWGMGCSPCRAAIQKSKDLRASIAQRKDVKLIFIAAENTPQGSEAYRKYVKEWLADEECICLSPAEYNQLCELFRFNAIPHYETITPEGYRVREDLSINGFHNFNDEFARLQQQAQSAQPAAIGVPADAIEGMIINFNGK